MSERVECVDGGVRLSGVLAGLSYALDLTEGQRPGHSVRSCVIGMRLADVLGLNEADRSSLFYALVMKDLGCSSNAARFAALFGASDHDLKSDLQHIDWSRALESFRFVVRNAAPGQPLLSRVWRLLAVLSRGPEGAREVVRTRCERGADIARLLRLTTPRRRRFARWTSTGMAVASRTNYGRIRFRFSMICTNLFNESGNIGSNSCGPRCRGRYSTVEEIWENIAEVGSTTPIR